jgi:futalosine hydrolase
VLLVVAATERELEVVRGVETFCCGIGPVEAGVQSARALAERRPDAVLNVGIAGGRAIEPPALVLGSESVYEDLVDPAMKLARVVRLEADAPLLAAARAVLPEALVQPIATVGRVGRGAACAVEAMEGFGVLRAAALAGVPALELRAVSNDPGEPDRSRWRIADALAALEAALARLVPVLSGRGPVSETNTRV